VAVSIPWVNPAFTDAGFVARRAPASSLLAGRGHSVHGGVLPAADLFAVRPAMSADWRHHCREYDACGQPVFCVRHYCVTPIFTFPLSWHTTIVHDRDEHRYHRDEHRD